MKVSFVIPTIGRPELDRAIESCKVQDVEGEIIVSDDSDEGVDRDDVIVVEGGGSIPVSRNLGAEAATGEYIVNLDDDDWFSYESAVSDMLNLVDDQTSLVTGWIETEKGINKTPQDVWPDILGTNVIGSNSGTLIPQDVYWSVGGYDPEQVYQNDHEMWIRLCQVGEVKILEKPVVKYDLDSDNKITSDPLSYHHRRRIYYKHKDLFTSLPFRDRVRVTSEFFKKQNELRFNDSLEQRDIYGSISGFVKTVASDPRSLVEWDFWRKILLHTYPDLYEKLE